ncbi:hypothetical protein LV779_22690 [Streptomyces thinghirensis]|nr:hypothetical protein [Streptomyces thinghirensis]
MESEGLRVCRGWSARCPLEGTTNVQGRAAQRQHATFVHLELAPDTRGDGRDADEVRGRRGRTAQRLGGRLTGARGRPSVQQQPAAGRDRRFRASLLRAASSSSAG